MSTKLDQLPTVIFDHDTALEFKTARYVYAVNEAIVQNMSTDDSVCIEHTDFPPALDFDKDFFVDVIVPLYSVSWDITVKAKSYNFTKKSV